ncbi:MAG: hypothetical protein P8M65_13380 [Roseibacillus sp.]|nr:hypothetical protein [Roseibacillus sp.]
MNPKILLFAASLALLGQGPLAARTWTSGDGSKTFEGELRALSERAKTVTVLMEGGKLRTFKISLLSEEDRNFLRKEGHKIILAASAGKGADNTLQEQKIGKNLAKEGILSKLEGESFVGHKLTKTPDYYIVYFSASW